MQSHERKYLFLPQILIKHLLCAKHHGNLQTAGKVIKQIITSINVTQGTTLCAFTFCHIPVWGLRRDAEKGTSPLRPEE